MGRPRPPQDGRLYVSPSQIKLWRRCRRKWAFRYVEGRPEPKTAKQQFGTDCHEHLERWVRESVPPPKGETGDVARQLIRPGWIPTPTPALAEWAERPIAITLDHVRPKLGIWGFSDLIVPPGLTVPPAVVDYKFTSSTRWAMSEAEAERDPQTLCYGRYAMDEFGRDEAVARFLYGIASNPKAGPRMPKGAKLIEVTLRRGEDPFDAGWAAVERDVGEIADARRGWEDANADAPFNPEACEDFGGCPYATLCRRPKGAAVAAVAGRASRPSEEKEVLTHCDDNAIVDLLRASIAREETKKMSLLDKIRKAKGSAEPQPQQQPASAPAEAPAPASGTLLERLQAHSQAAGVNSPPPAEEPSQPDGVAQVGVNPETSLGAMGVRELKAMAKEAGIKGYSTLPKTKLVEALEAALEFPPAEAPKAEAPKAEAPKAEAPKADGPGLMVLFDCAPRKGGVVGSVRNLSDWIKPVADKVAADNDVPHWGFIQYTAQAALAAALDAALTASPPSGCVLVDSYSLEGRALKDVLIRHASIVIQGVR